MSLEAIVAYGNAAYNESVTVDDVLQTISTNQSVTAGLGGNLGGRLNADAMCQKTAEARGSTGKTWRAFLSVNTLESADTTSKNAIERIGSGPWYNYNGLLVAQDISGLQRTRPNGTTTGSIFTYSGQSYPLSGCLTDEFGRCILYAYGNSKGAIDTHDVMTGSQRDGTLYATTNATCNDWTSTSITCSSGSSGGGQMGGGAMGGGASTCAPALGHGWPRQASDVSDTSAISGSLTSDDDANWMYAHMSHGCNRGMMVGWTGMDTGVGGGGGYGAWYCFALSN